MELQEISEKIKSVAKFFDEQVHVSGKENSRKYSAGIEYLENLANQIVIPTKNEEIKNE